ncbi:MAG: hypothetical protein H6657_23780 [Ardenticatenaceae bacterium]|nr:hypothetical protein [Ardenticatenaceae bacterium]
MKTLFVPAGIIAIICYAIFSQTVSLNAIHNINAVTFNRGLGDPRLGLEERLAMLTALTDSSIGATQKVIAAQEVAAYQEAVTHLQQKNLHLVYEVGTQLLYNPEFNLGLNNWIQHNSSWQLSSTTQVSDSFVAEHSRGGEGHSSLSQTLALTTGRCYLFVTQAAVTRADSIPSYWLYWETYSPDNSPMGNSLLSNIGTQPWTTYADVFCLPQANNEKERVTVAPVNLYGNATAYVGSVRLYLLNSIEQER